MEKLLLEHYFKIEDNYWWFQGMRYIYNSYITIALQKELNPKILDIGCGSGLYTKSLSSFGETVGLDIESSNLILCRQKGFKKLVQAEANFLPFKDKSFDLIVSFNLIEHLSNDSDFIKEIYRVLKDSCRLILATSAFKFLWSCHDVSNEHKRRYSRKSLMRILENYFGMERISYTNFILFFPILIGIIIHNLLFRNINKVNGGFIRLPGFINKILLLILRLEALLIKQLNFPFGISLLCIAKKTA